jgi:hypothetical protein
MLSKGVVLSRICFSIRSLHIRSPPPTPTIGSVGRSSEPRPAGGYADTDKIPLFDVRPYASKRGYYA